ncbi:DUF3010 family protein [Sphingomonas sp. Root1294]|uniref:DUF3010 family protein n=1 Tax=Sphingomonas sp. Root1294 TaxID=1736447 RepID=UPI0006FEDC6B|nr:DUF3010 family protein [Sphingomonas sp. Root1294]KQX20698.1 hypothetical protein ASD17_07280 [Sphingomonas sp. Root1294]KQY68543.1 hypothetical protein ASD39_03800 [Sphingomonas sp. Root50]
MDIRSNEATLVLVEAKDDVTVYIKCATKKLALNDDKEANSLNTLKAAIEAFAMKHDVETFIIKARQSSGRMAASGVTFKIEALFQLAGTPVEFVSAPTLSKFAKSNKGGIPTGVAKYQEDAFRAGAWRLAGQ